MLTRIKKSTAYKLLPKRDPNSHKGENGKVMIIGGSIEYYGAPILAGLGALNSGADLVYLYVPECNFDVSRSMYPDFIVKKFKGDFLTPEVVDEIIEFGKEMDCILIGPGIGKEEESVSAVVKILNELHIPTVLDAGAISALKKITKFPLQQPITITPHHNEFHNLIDKDIMVSEENSRSVVLLRSLSMDLHINVLLKGPLDFISSEEGFVEVNETGNAGMTVGGSGDVLSGIVSSFMAQGLEGFDACRSAAFFFGKTGDFLKKRKGYFYSASELANAFPFVI